MNILPTAHHLDLVTLVLPGHHQNMVTVFPTGTELILVTQVLTLASSVQGDSGSSWASPVTGDSDPKHGLTRPGDCGSHGTSPGPYVSAHTWASPVPGVSGTHLGSISIWLHCSLTVTHPDLLTLVFTCATPGRGDTGSHQGLTWTW